jgi:hypothetical protein
MPIRRAFPGGLVHHLYIVGGGLMSSVDDLLLWDNNFYTNKLGKGTLVKELESRGALNDGKQVNYGMGLG